MIDGDDADAIVLQRQADVGLRLDRMHVEHLGIRRDGAHGREFARRSDVEGPDPGLDQRLQHDLLAIGLDRIGGLAGEHPHELPGICLQHFRAEAIDRLVWTERERRFAGIFESLHGCSSVRGAESQINPGNAIETAGRARKSFPSRRQWPQVSEIGAVRSGGSGWWGWIVPSASYCSKGPQTILPMAGHHMPDRHRTVRCPRHLAMLLLLGAIWGGSFFFARIAVAEIHPLRWCCSGSRSQARLCTSISGPRAVLSDSLCRLPRFFSPRADQQCAAVLADICRPDRDGRRPRLRAQCDDAVLDDGTGPGADR